MITPNASLTSAARIFERARQAVADAPVEVGEERILVTVSIGVAERMPDEKRAALVARAAEALRSAKKRGNSVRVAIEEE